MHCRGNSFFFFKTSFQPGTVNKIKQNKIMKCFAAKSAPTTYMPMDHSITVLNMR